MALSLTSKLRSTIQRLEKYPNDSMDIDFTVPYKLLKDSNKLFVELAEKQKNSDKIISHEIQSNRVEGIIKEILIKSLTIGISYNSNPKLIENSIRYTLEYIISNYLIHLSWNPVNNGIPYPNDEVEELDKKVNLTRFALTSPWYELNYGIENSLFIWNGIRWRITPLGNFFKSLSIPAGTVFLLSLETYLNVPERSTPFNINPWHMSKLFLNSFYKNGYTNIDIGECEYDLYEFDPNMHFLNRLDEFQLTNTNDLTEEYRILPEELDGLPVIHIADDFFQTTLTLYGQEIIKRVLDEEHNIFKEMIDNLITEELISDGKYVLRFDTIQYIKSIERNSLMHGSISPSGEICECFIAIMINVLIKIFEDYGEWKSNR
jgi:hypothetical protein